MRFIFFLTLSLTLPSESYLIKPKYVLDVVTGQLTKLEVKVEDGIISEIGINLTSNGSEVLSLPNTIIMPGFIDTHVHLIGNNELNGYESVGESSYLATLYGVKNAEATLLAGFTTVRNVGASNYTDVALKSAINRGVIAGPRMYVSGPPLGITGGHCDNNLMPYERSRPNQGVVDSPWQARQKVRENRKFGADLIKFCATGGVMSKNTDVNAKQFTYEEMKAIVDEAHNHGMRVAAHAHGLEGIRTALLAGVDSIEHSSFINEEVTLLAIQNGAFLSMDIYVSDYILGEGAKKGILEESLEKERKVGLEQRKNFKKAVELGAKITFGTDAGIYKHGENAKQFAYMVEWGMSPLQAIQAATITGSELIGNNNLGKIKVGYVADIVGVNSNPLKDIRVLEDVSFVMKEGTVFKSQ
ncbi:MAG: amidohydrolase family protein [SAR86 cluster bacterium]|nr:amidohydrolase family protein [SAR86 cluster bacterium]